MKKNEYNDKSCFGKISTLHADRLHVEIPKKDRKKFESGDSVKVTRIE